MRTYEDSDPSSFNSFRSGNENPRRDNSTRNEFGTNQASMRQGSNEGTSDHWSNSGPNQYSAYQPFNRQNDQQNNNWSQNNQRYNRDQFDNNRQYNQGHSSGFGNQQSNFRNDNNRFNQHNEHHDWQRSQNRNNNDDRNFFERAGDRIQDTWNRWTDDDDNNNFNRGLQQFRNQNQHNQSRFNNFDQNSTRHSSDYNNQNNFNQGRSFDSDRYQNRRNQHEDEGFFDRMGNKISQAWNNFTGDDEERRYQERGNMNSQHHWNNTFNQNRGHQEDNPRRNFNRNDGPPYNYGSSSERDYEW
ncbi:hypothetical protein HUW51_15490 [Adhaeribacter swui]|uniref:Uncharacterized protein n=1 Tax=Adhaeribacter swui TaxID=2086471 RepID=A0A7G7GA73_9BACT|nr:hypothetical protein [Adhaeribacter swui]QNF34057.1 hypothetical protein HUW51_15490 [Adhaeribacter swui]